MPANGHVLLKPISIAQTGTSATIGTNGKVSFTSISSLNVNQVFNSDHTNYVVVAQYTGSGALTVNLVLRDSSAATPADSATGYSHQSLVVDGTTLTAARNTTATSVAISTISNTLNCGSIIYISRPVIAEPTNFRVISCSDGNNATLYNYTAYHSIASAYSGFTITTSTGSISGNLTVYGVRK